MLLPEGGGFYTALFHIGTSLVSYEASAWRGGFCTALVHLLQYYIMIKKGEGEKTTTNQINPYYILSIFLHYFYPWFPTVLVISRF